MPSTPEELSPLATPQSPALTYTPAYTLFDANSVSLATFFGTPVAGATLMAVNDRRLGVTARGVMILIAAILVTALDVFLGWNIPQGFSAPIAILLVFAMQRIALRLQGTAVKDHVQRGGRLASKWSAFGVAVVFLVSIFAVVFFAIYLPAYKLDHGPKIVVGTKDEVFYSGSATQANAQAVGNALKADGYFSDKGVTVMVDKGAAGTVVSFVVKEGIWSQPDMVASFDEIGREVAPQLGGFPIQVRLLNKERDVKNTSTVGQLAVGNDHIYFMGTATAAEAQSVAKVLKSDQYFEGKGADVFLSKQSDGTTLSFVVGDGVWDDASMVSSFEKIARDAAPGVGGLPLKLNLENTTLDVKKSVAVN
jgi:hypothetical protein